MRNRLANSVAVTARRTGLAAPGPRRALGRGLLAGVVALGLGASASARAQSPGPGPRIPAGPASQAGQALQFRGARLGMTIAQWKALPYPGGTSTHVETTCVNGPKRSAALGASRTAPADPGARLAPQRRAVLAEGQVERGVGQRHVLGARVHQRERQAVPLLHRVRRRQLLLAQVHAHRPRARARQPCRPVRRPAAQLDDALAFAGDNETVATEARHLLNRLTVAMATS